MTEEVFLWLIGIVLQGLPMTVVPSHHLLLDRLRLLMSVIIVRLRLLQVEVEVSIVR